MRPYGHKATHKAGQTEKQKLRGLRHGSEGTERYGVADAAPSEYEGDACARALNEIQAARRDTARGRIDC